MLSYVNRRKRWWTTLRELDPEVRLSEAMRANLLVELSGLSRPQRLMVKTAATSETMHAQVSDERKVPDDRELGASYPTTRSWPQSPNRPWNLLRDPRARTQRGRIVPLWPFDHNTMGVTSTWKCQEARQCSHLAAPWIDILSGSPHVPRVHCVGPQAEISTQRPGKLP